MSDRHKSGVRMVRRAVAIDHHDGEWHVERADGSVMVTIDVAQAISWVRADDRAIAKRKEAAVVSVITWNGAPAGFEAPR